MTAQHYPSLEAYTADVERARDAYAADMAVQNGLCAVCKRRKRDRRDSTSLFRQCGTCRRQKAVA